MISRTPLSAIDSTTHAAGFAGLNQINARILAGAPTGGDVPVSITVEERQAIR